MKSRGARDGRAVRWDQHRNARREELIDAAVDAVRRHGADVRMESIADAAGTSKAVVYRYFDDKQELYRAVGQRLADQLATDIAAAVGGASDPRARLEAGVEAYLALLERDPELYRFVVHNPSLSGRDDGAHPVVDYTTLVSEFVTAIVRDDLVARGVDRQGAVPSGVALVGAVRAVGDWWLNQPAASRPTRRQLVTYLVQLMHQGLTGLASADVRANPEHLPTGPHATGRATRQRPSSVRSTS